MRRLNDAPAHGGRDRGASTIFVVLMMPILILAGAFVFDGGRGVVARRETQNAADAGALAKATDCARAIPTTSFTPYQTNGAILANAPTCGSDSRTTVTMSKTIDLAFVPGGGGSRTVTRSATARWGTLGSATATPVVISSCEYSTALLDGTTDVFFLLDNPRPQSGCSSLPGGFSLLDGSPGDRCAVAITSGSAATGPTGQPGNALQQIIPCITNSTAPALPRDVLIAIYDSVACQAANCQGNDRYPIIGFAMLRITGYSLNGNRVAGVGMPRDCPGAPRQGTTSCIRGDFIRFVTSQGTPGTSTNFGLLQVSLVS